MRKKRRSSCVRITKHLLFYATSVCYLYPLRASHRPKPPAPYPNRGRENRRAKAKKIPFRVSFSYISALLCVGQPQHFGLPFSFLEMRGPMFRWVRLFWQNSPPALSGGLQGAFEVVACNLIWVWVSDTSFLREKEVCVAAAKRKKKRPSLSTARLTWGGFLLSDGLFLL